MVNGKVFLPIAGANERGPRRRARRVALFPPKSPGYSPMSLRQNHGESPGAFEGAISIFIVRFRCTQYH